MFGCDIPNNQKEVNMPFQCINSQSVCEVNTQLGTFLVKFNAEKVLTESPFKILVEFKNKGSNNKEISSRSLFKVAGFMEGKTMFMGKVPLFFTESGSSSHNYTAETMLGSCSEELMTWRLWLTIEKQGINSNTEQTSFFIDFNSTRF
jgi:hypothetical protein